MPPSTGIDSMLRVWSWKTGIEIRLRGKLSVATSGGQVVA
jgi:hypothetical protein